MASSAAAASAESSGRGILAVELGAEAAAWRLESCCEPDSLALWGPVAQAAERDAAAAPGHPLYSRLINLNMKAAAPGGYAIVMSQMSSGGAPGPRPPAVAVGIVDSGYRGSLRAVVWAPGPAPAAGAGEPPAGLALRLTLARLAPAPPRLVAAAADEDGADAASGRATAGGAEVPFAAAFAPKRDEDAGHDIAMPRAAVLAPGESLRVRLPVAYAEGGLAGVPYVFGRSSCNLRGLVVLPTAWPAGAPCRFVLRNVTREPIAVAAGQRVAQLLLLARRLEWLPPGLNDGEPFPVSPRAAPPAPGAPRLRWRRVADLAAAAPASERGARGFGSTGL
ncbi:deoxyuridine triphosphatase [Cervid alphaherpesvirus 3]|uniref:Deoxyuridine triphosphatase n=1 Tax=Cervid alphaherpesvirus 3 TaxID=2115790 RepID=A0A455JII8_9ALPH|nr:deoxyuridine triphosphatase [Cervid alphaherpesvirus 3]AVT50599.1 deoxyuridine triphosphatase [Cervid alphaherpesvirus 3]